MPLIFAASWSDPKWFLQNLRFGIEHTIVNDRIGAC